MELDSFWEKRGEIMLFGVVLVMATFGFGVVARMACETMAREADNGRVDLAFASVVGLMVALADGVIILITTVQVGWPWPIALLAVATATGLGLSWRTSMPAIGRALAQPRVLRPLIIGGLVIAAIWLFGVSLPFRAVVLQLIFLAFVVWLLATLFRPFRLVKKKD